MTIGAFNITFPPVQNVVTPAVIVAVGKAFTVTIVAADVAEQPLSVTVTVYDPAAVAVKVCAVAAGEMATPLLFQT